MPASKDKRGSEIFTTVLVTVPGLDRFRQESTEDDHKRVS